MGLYEDLLHSKGDFDAYTQLMTMRTRKQRFLYDAVLQLTPLCNLKCKMCYARMDNKQICYSGKHVMRFDEWKFYIDAFAQMGVVELVFTGGECTLHPDFKEIYAYAYDEGFNIVVMTNATYFPAELQELWLSKPPAQISMTLYGASPETYGRLCGDSSACVRAYENMEKFKELGFGVNIKYTVVKDTLPDFEKVNDYVTERGGMLKYSPNLAQFDQFDRDNLDAYAVDMDEFSEISLRLWCKRTGLSREEGLKRDMESTEDFCRTMPDKGSVIKNGIGCSAARNNCHIDWEGYMTPCVGFDAFREDPRKIGMEACWKKMTEWADGVPQLTECQTCVHKGHCPSCIAIHYADVGEFGKPSPRLCWKKNHPEEAAKIEAELAAKGLIPQNAD